MDKEIINYTDLDLKNNQETKIITINNKEIEVFQYLPILEKYKIINLTLAESLENNIYNPVKVEIFFNLNLVFNYTTLYFSAEELLDPYELFDKMEQNRVFEKIIAAIPETEYKYLLENLITTMTRNTQYVQSLAASFETLFNELPKLVDNMKEVTDNMQNGNLTIPQLQKLAQDFGVDMDDIQETVKKQMAQQTQSKEEKNN